MRSAVSDIPEIEALEARTGIVRIPIEVDVPFTPRVRRLVDAPEFRRLSRVSQLGLVSLVYPGATHSRFEHALGVYHLMLRYLRQLCRDRRFSELVSPHDAEVAIVAALLHDLGHWPFCHAIEDLHLPDVPRHEDLAARFLNEDGALAELLRKDWDIEPSEVLELITQGDQGSGARGQGVTSRERQRAVHGQDLSEHQPERLETRSLTVAASDGSNPVPETPNPSRDAGVAAHCPESQSRGPNPDKQRLLRSLLSGPIDVDKMDYLQRDSLHAGIPYGRHFDPSRLIGSLTLKRAGDGLALSEKGKTAAELMVFARYVMFSEVYWHHAVRSATAMLGRAFYETRRRLNMDDLYRNSEQGMISHLTEGARGTPWAELLDALFGPQRRLYKRLAQFSSFEQPEVYHRLARRPYPWLVDCARHLAELLSAETRTEIAPHEILIDAPPVQREVEFDVEIYFLKEDTYRPLEDVSPVVRALARQQFDDYVKRVRVFCHPRLAGKTDACRDLPSLLVRAIGFAEGERQGDKGARRQGEMVTEG